MKISEHVEMLELRTDKGAYYPVIVHDAAHVVLVDTGFPMHFELLQAAMHNAGCESGAVTAIIYTHQDIDHVGGTKEVLKYSPRAQIMAHELEAPYIDGTLAPLKLASMDKNNPVYSIMKTGFARQQITIDRKLTDGETLPICGGIEVIHTPGHTPGHICLYVREDKVLICGDALNVQNGRLIGANPIYTQDMQQANESARKLAKYDARAVLSYHCGLYWGSAEDFEE